MQHATKTDLSLLLECLKCQMKCPDSQKQALLTIYAICQQSGENVEYFHDLGGVMFVHSLSQSSPHPPVKQTALFILGALTESNAYCKQALCRRETFLNLLESLQPEVPITQKRVAVYMLSALVSNNRSGQEFAHTSDCIQMLMDLFRWSFPLSSEAEAVGESQMTQLWAAVSSALCACVNNPQNDLNQRVCMSAFPLVCSWLQQMSPPRPDLLQPLCSFITMTLHNNSCAQEYFSAVGGLGTLCVSLADLVTLSAESPPACSMAITLTKTLAACITDNSGLAAGLSALQLVPVLVLLLSCPNLEPKDQLSIVLTMALCTDSSEEHQSQMLANGGLPLVISLLTETQDEELKKAAIFVLQTCKKITGMLAPGLGSVQEREHQSELESHWESAKEILQRINNLENKQLQAGEEQWERDVGNSADQQEGTFGIPNAPPPQTPSLQRSDPTEEFWEGTPLRRVKGRHEGWPRHRNYTHKEQPVRRDIFKSVPEKDQLLQSHPATVWDMERGREKERRGEREEERQRGREEEEEEDRDGERERERGERRSNRERDHALTETRKKRQDSEWGRERGSTARRKGEEERESTALRERGEREGGVERDRRRDGEREKKRDREREREREMDRSEREGKRDVEGERGNEGRWSGIPETERGGDREGRERSGRSRIPAHLNSTSLTDTHCRQPAEGAKHTDSLHVFRRPDPLQSFAPLLKPRVPSEDEMSICSEVLDKEIQRVLLTPASFTHSTLRCLAVSLTPLKRPPHRPVRCRHREEQISEDELMTETSEAHYRKRNRRDFSGEELGFLREGVQRFGPSWNSILWAYPFQPGRTNVDLAQKYRRMKKTEAPL